jgi:DNA-binding SARP family transcriptional activator
MSVRIHLFGRFRAVRDDGLGLPHFDNVRLAELLAYLVLHRGRSLNRERVAGHLWGDTSTRASLTHLRHALWQLHTATSEIWSCIQSDRRWLRLDAPCLWIDVDVFEQAFTNTRDVTGFDLGPEAARGLEVAAGLYADELLTGWDADWCNLERERFRSLYVAMLDKLMDHALHVGRPEAGLERGAASLALDGAREPTHQRIMQLLYAAGDRTAALRQYDRCAQALDAELGIRPGRRTEALREALVADRGVHALAFEVRRERASELGEDVRYLHELVKVLERQVMVDVDPQR